MTYVLTVMKKRRGKFMKKLLKKMVEVYAKSSTNSCTFFLIHQPKAPRTMIEK